MSNNRELADLISQAGGTSEGVLAGRRNLIINGAMQVWQRSESASFSGNVAYNTADRFMIWLGGGSGSTSKQTDVLNGESFNYLRVVNDGNGTNANAVFLRQRLEDLAFLGGKTTTLSFRAKASSVMSVNFYQRHSYGSGGSATEDIGGTESVTLGTSWQEYTVTLPAWNTMSGKTFGADAFAMLGFQADTTSAWTVDITNVQLEVGSVATPFEHRSYGEELALCQRYYWQGMAAGNSTAFQYAASGTDMVVGSITFPSELRVYPSFSVVTVPTYYNCSNIEVVASTTGLEFRADVTATGKYRVYNGVYAADAEL